MANVKISALNSATTPLDGTETIPIVQGGETKKTNVSNLGFRGLHSLIPLQSGDWTNNSIGQNLTSGPNSVSYSEKILCYPYIPNQTFTISSINISVTSAYSVFATIRLSIYSDLNGKPDNLLLSSTDLSANPFGVKTYNTTFTFVQGVTYWLGYQTSSGNTTGAIASVAAAGSILIKLNGSVGSSTSKYIFNAPYASGAPISLLGASYTTDALANPTFYLVKA
jgi:hypothetical protein